MNTNLAVVLFVPVLVALNPALLVAVFVMILFPCTGRASPLPQVTYSARARTSPQA